MKIMKKGKGFMNAALMCFFFIFAFIFGTNGVTWFWNGMEMVPIILGISAMIFGSFWGYADIKKLTFIKKRVID